MPKSISLIANMDYFVARFPGRFTKHTPTHKSLHQKHLFCPLLARLLSLLRYIFSLSAPSGCIISSTAGSASPIPTICRSCTRGLGTASTMSTGRFAFSTAMGVAFGLGSAASLLDWVVQLLESGCELFECSLRVCATIIGEAAFN